MIDNPSISRDGHHIAYAQGNQEANIFKVAFDPRGETLIGQPQPITQGSTRRGGVAVSPDGNWLAYHTIEPPQHIFVMRSNGSVVLQLTSGTFRDTAPRWSPDGRRIAFRSDRSGQSDVWLINADGSGLQQLTHAAGTGEPVFGPGDWSPDSKRFLYLVVGKEPRLIDIDTPWNKQRPESLPATGLPGQVDFARWSPDGEKIALCWGCGFAPGVQRLYDIRTRTYTQLQSSLGVAAAWLSDSRRMITRRPQNFGILAVATSRSHELFALTANTITSLDLSADNRTIYVTRSINQADIWMITLK